MDRLPRRLTGLFALGALSLAIGLAACTQPGATPSPQ